MVNEERKTTCTKNRLIRLYPCSFVCLYLVFFVLNTETVSATSKWENAFGKWVDEFGEELYHLAKLMTKKEEIKSKYSQYNAKVALKGNLIKTTEENIGRMLRKKIDAVRCISSVAEDAAEDAANKQFNFTYEHDTLQYYSSKYSSMCHEKMIEGELQWDCKNCTTDECQFHTIMNYSRTYKPIYLTRDTHFYDISVNTSHSSVHVPTNVFDHSDSSLRVLKWSSKLNKVFVSNYQADPALSWQYFGSNTGILRHYPAKSWEDRDIESSIDVYDCRKRSWYIETATCSKEVVILLDNTGSMFNFLSFLAQLTIKGILDTFSNNDFFNIFIFSNGSNGVIDCFNGSMIQATPENKKVFEDKVSELKPNGYANDSDIIRAFEQAFNILGKKRNCTEEKPCNQAIMYISDSIQGNITDVMERRNRNGSFIPIRIFTYLLGKEPTNVNEMKQLACQNRGGFQHIQTLDEVAEKVLEYVKIIAAPLVLQGKRHPPTWTHAFKDVTYKDEETSEQNRIYDGLLPPRLMIAVGVPAFVNVSSNATDDKNINGTETYKPTLLGVASTDVPVQDIDRLSLPYLLGVNGYSFIVSNNGYVLLHPDLRPNFYYTVNVTHRIEVGNTTFHKYQNIFSSFILKDNYNSIDITEIEQIDGIDDFTNTTVRPKLGGEKLKILRDLAFNNKEGNLLNVSVRFHYDNMRRADEEQYDYYFTPLKYTPFTLGLAIPSTYGRTYIKVNDEIHDNINMGVNISEWFLGENWKINPDWVYCRYHYLEGHEFNNSQIEWLHFVSSFYNKTWKWSSQYDDDDNESDEELNDELKPQCEGRKTLDLDGYYCNKELVQMLVFDAKITNTSYDTWKFNNQADKKLATIYNANLRFVATMSGLTRWQFICGEIEVEDDKEFGDYYTKAIDETWYKAAVLQHKVDPESFVYSVPHDDSDDTAKEEGENKVTASYAIFRKDGVLEAPGCVVGFQFGQREMNEQFLNITAKDHCNGCLETCASENVRCIVIDNNGYIVLSKDMNEFGKFFGEDYGVILEILLNRNVFKDTTIYDFQAMCIKPDGKAPSSAIALKPFKAILNMLTFGFMQLMIFLSKMTFWTNAESLQCDTPPPPPPPPNDDSKYIPKNVFKKRDAEERKRYVPCDKKAILYIMQQEHKHEETVQTDKEDFYYRRIPYSNLLFIYVKDDKIQKNKNIFYDASMQRIEYENYAIDGNETIFPCHKINVNELKTRSLEDCFTCDENEEFDCSNGIKFMVDQRIFSYCLFSSIVIIVLTFRSIQ